MPPDFEPGGGTRGVLAVVLDDMGFDDGSLRRLESFDRLNECVEAGKKAAHIWSDDDSADVPPYFLDSLANFVDAYPSRTFD